MLLLLSLDAAATSTTSSSSTPPALLLLPRWVMLPPASAAASDVTSSHCRVILTIAPRCKLPSRQTPGSPKGMGVKILLLVAWILWCPIVIEIDNAAFQNMSTCGTVDTAG